MRMRACSTTSGSIVRLNIDKGERLMAKVLILIKDDPKTGKATVECKGRPKFDNIQKEEFKTKAQVVGLIIYQLILEATSNVNEA